MSADDDPDVHLRQAGAHVDREEEPDGEVLGRGLAVLLIRVLGFGRVGLGYINQAGFCGPFRDGSVAFGWVVLGVGGWGLGI